MPDLPPPADMPTDRTTDAPAPMTGAPTLEAATAPAIEVAGVARSFGGPPALAGVSLTVGPGELVAMLGPSGCGKTTLLRVIAGLEVPDAGRVVVAGRTLTDIGGGRREQVPPERRRVGMVFQDWALFPHLSVARNVAYGVPKGPDRDERVRQALAMVDLTGLGDRLPSTLSGGQQQRVALARAIAPQPSVLLLDEPFSNLDTALRVHVRTELHELLVELGITTVFVTHDQEEAFVLGDRVAVMRGGELLQMATPAELYRRPVDRWVAGFVGDVNFLPGRRDSGAGEVVTACGPVPVLDPGAVAGDVDVLVRPEDLVVDAGEAGTVELTEFYGHTTVYVIDLDAGVRLRARQPSAPRFARGDRVAVRYAGGPAPAYRHAAS